jgi:hypothetical protein
MPISEKMVCGLSRLAVCAIDAPLYVDDTQSLSVFEL